MQRPPMKTSPKRTGSRQPASEAPLPLRYHEFGTWLHGTPDATETQIRTKAAELVISASTNSRYKAIQLSRVIPRSEMKELCKLDKKTGRKLTWTHFVELLQVEKSQKRRQLRTEVLRDGLDGNLLRRRIQKLTGRGNRRPRSGRHPREPHDLDVAVFRAEKLLRRLKYLVGWIQAQRAVRVADEDPDQALQMILNFLGSVALQN